MARITRDNTDGVLKEADRITQERLEIAALMIERSAKIFCPVKTGTLKRSITHGLAPGIATIGTNVVYAPYVELGTSRWSGKPFLMPALEVNRAGIAELFGAK